MSINKSKIRCPKCRTVYSINVAQSNINGKKSARCIICESRFFIENREDMISSDMCQNDVLFLQSYFEKRGSLATRRQKDRRKDIKFDTLSLSDFPHDIIPIFNSEGNALIGHISPGRRQGQDRRSGIERRQCLLEGNNTGTEVFNEYRLDGCSEDAA